MESWKQALARLAGDQLMSLKRQAFLLCGDDSQAEDLVQEALVRAFTRPMCTPRPGAAEAYVRMIMVRLFIDGARRRNRWLRAAPLLTLAEVTPDPADRLATQGAVIAALGGLPPRQRACVVLRYYQDLPVAQVASALGIAEGTAKRYLSEAKTQLAAWLAPMESE